MGNLFPPNNSASLSVDQIALKIRNCRHPKEILSVVSNEELNFLYQNDTEFRQFADMVKGKSPGQAFQERGLDISRVLGLF